MQPCFLRAVLYKLNFPCGMHVLIVLGNWRRESRSLMPSHATTCIYYAIYYTEIVSTSDNDYNLPQNICVTRHTKTRHIIDKYSNFIEFAVVIAW